MSNTSLSTAATSTRPNGHAAPSRGGGGRAAKQVSGPSKFAVVHDHVLAGLESLLVREVRRAEIGQTKEDEDFRTFERAFFLQ